jgi:two-component system response regulator FixJ
MTTNPVIHAVDDDERFLAALMRSLHETGLPVRGYSSGQELLDSLETSCSGCVVSDLRMPGMDGLELYRRLKARGARLPMIFITGHGDARQAVAALKAGAADFLEKPFPEQVLLNSVGQALEADAVERRLRADKAVVRERYENLSPRERAVFALVVSNLHNKEIASELRISPRTVEHHREHVMLKMRAQTMAELLTMAMLCGVRELHL